MEFPIYFEEIRISSIIGISLPNEEVLVIKQNPDNSDSIIRNNKRNFIIVKISK